MDPQSQLMLQTKFQKEWEAIAINELNLTEKSEANLAQFIQILDYFHFLKSQETLAELDDAAEARGYLSERLVKPSMLQFDLTKQAFELCQPAPLASSLNRSNRTISEKEHSGSGEQSGDAVEDQSSNSVTICLESQNPVVNVENVKTFIGTLLNVNDDVLDLQSQVMFLDSSFQSARTGQPKKISLKSSDNSILDAHQRSQKQMTLTDKRGPQKGALWQKYQPN